MYPHFKGDFVIAYGDPFPKAYIDETFSGRLAHSNLEFEITERRTINFATEGNWISDSSAILFFLSDSLIHNHFKKGTEEFKCLMDALPNLIHFFPAIQKISNDTTPIGLSPSGFFSVYYKSPNNFIFHFIFDFTGTLEEYTQTFYKIFELIEKSNTIESNELYKFVRSTTSGNNSAKHLIFLEGSWKILDPLMEVTKSVNERYRKNKDVRIKKPFILINRDDYRKNLILSTNWVLTFDGLETLMVQPNDVAIYSSIAEKKLKEAKEFYDNYIIPRHGSYSGGFPSDDAQIKYYDYFEAIITATVFACTSLEAFANICVPESYEYIDEKEGEGIKTIYSKAAIERKFSLKDKFKKVLPKLLDCPHPASERWWNDFINLEDIRNEIIHSKPLKSEERYSKLLAKNIFSLIPVYKSVLSYFGYYIYLNQKMILNEIPYGFGFDEVCPHLTSQKNYEKSRKVIFGETDDTNQ